MKVRLNMYPKPTCQRVMGAIPLHYPNTRTKSQGVEPVKLFAEFSLSRESGYHRILTAPIDVLGLSEQSELLTQGSKQGSGSLDSLHTGVGRTLRRIEWLTGVESLSIAKPEEALYYGSENPKIGA